MENVKSTQTTQFAMFITGITLDLWFSMEATILVSMKLPEK